MTLLLPVRYPVVQLLENDQVYTVIMIRFGMT